MADADKVDEFPVKRKRGRPKKQRVAAILDERDFGGVKAEVPVEAAPEVIEEKGDEKAGVLQFKTSPVFVPLLGPHRYKAAYGGRGSGKSHFFAESLVEDALRYPADNNGEGLRAVCIREVQKDLSQSAKLLIEDKIARYGLSVGHGFRIYREAIQCPGDGLIIFKGMQDYSADSIKSLENFHRAWIEEAHTLSQRSLDLLRPTIRAPNSEIWASWNPSRAVDPIDKLFRGDTTPTDAVVVRANWNDNMWFPAVLEQERQDCLSNQPDQYQHIWEGGYVTVVEGAYYAQALSVAKLEGRIGPVAFDPLIRVKVHCDIGGTGGKSDAFTMWPNQSVGKEIRVRDYYEAVGQDAAAHVNYLHAKGYTPDKATIVLPHDGKTQDRVFDVSYESMFRQAGYSVQVVPNQGKGAAMMRVEAARRLFPRVWFDEKTTKGGREALGWYHEKKDAIRGIGLGPYHDWSSNGADAFGLMCMSHEETRPNTVKQPRRLPVEGAWMA